MGILQMWFSLGSQSEREKEMISLHPVFVRYGLNNFITTIMRCFIAKVFCLKKKKSSPRSHSKSNSNCEFSYCKCYTLRHHTESQLQYKICRRQIFTPFFLTHSSKFLSSCLTITKCCLLKDM